MGNWKFTEEGVEVHGVGVFPLAGIPTAAEVHDVAKDVEAISAAFGSLKRAMVAFETGGAIYRDCLRNVADLQQGLIEGRDELQKSYDAMGTFFEPGRSPFDKVDPEQRLAFATALLQDIARRIQRPVSLRREPPPAAPTAPAAVPTPVAATPDVPAAPASAAKEVSAS